MFILKLDLPQGSLVSLSLFILHVVDLTEKMSLAKLALELTVFLYISNQNIFQCIWLMPRLCNELSKMVRCQKTGLRCELDKT